MPLPSTREGALLLEPFLEDPNAPQAVFGLPMSQPQTQYFTPLQGAGSMGYGGRGRYDPLGAREKMVEYQMRAEAEQHAAQAFQALQAVDPSAPDYVNKRTQIAAAFPLAAQDPRGKAVIEAYDYAYKAAQQDPQKAYRQQLALSGVTPEEFAIVKDPIALGNIAHQRKLEERPERRVGKSVEEQELDGLRKAYKDANDFGLGSSVKKAIEDRYQELQGKLRPQVFQPAAPTTQPTATPSLPRMSSPDEAMKLPPGTQFIDNEGKIRIRP